MYRIDSKEDIVIDKEISDEVSDSQRQAVEMRSQVDLAVDKEINKEVGNVEKEVATPPNIIQILLNMQNNIAEKMEGN